MTQPLYQPSPAGARNNWSVPFSLSAGRCGISPSPGAPGPSGGPRSWIARGRKPASPDRLSRGPKTGSAACRNPSTNYPQPVRNSWSVPLSVYPAVEKWANAAGDFIQNAVRRATQRAQRFIRWLAFRDARSLEPRQSPPLTNLGRNFMRLSNTDRWSLRKLDGSSTEARRKLDGSSTEAHGSSTDGLNRGLSGSGFRRTLGPRSARASCRRRSRAPSPRKTLSRGGSLPRPRSSWPDSPARRR